VSVGKSNSVDGINSRCGKWMGFKTKSERGGGVCVCVRALMLVLEGKMTSSEGIYISVCGAVFEFPPTQESQFREFNEHPPWSVFDS
jgi:hypothetical protein